MECEYKTAEIEKLEAKLEIVPEKDRRIFELQSKCADLYLEIIERIDPFEKCFNLQLKLSEILKNELKELKTSMNIVKQKNAESEEKLKKSKADHAEKEKLLMSLSERGLSDLKSERRSTSYNKVYTKFVQSPAIDSNINTQENKSLINVVDEETNVPSHIKKLWRNLKLIPQNKKRKQIKF